MKKAYSIVKQHILEVLFMCGVISWSQFIDSTMEDFKDEQKEKVD